ncbi:hypothetical protein DPMN_093000 [Dreissena polymorpha]|uniref:Uncharacterized protein n=1 Tax=Dreissena polymorpha TaxID=45954 RepID=A0A9D4L3B0_DREPO|nr:hypothetical protein DPMN_093000 [Dreissena polymorpha]
MSLCRIFYLNPERSSAFEQPLSQPFERPVRIHSTVRLFSTPSSDAATAVAQGHVSGDNVSGVRAIKNDDKNNTVTADPFTSPASRRMRSAVCIIPFGWLQL